MSSTSTVDSGEKTTAARDSELRLVTPEMVRDILSEDADRQLDAAKKLRGLLLKKNLFIEQIIECGIVPRLVEFLRNGQSVLQVEATWVLTNITSGSSKHTEAVINAGAVPEMIKLFSSPTLDVREQAVWTLGNIAGDCPQCRDYILRQGALQPLLTLLNEDHKLSTLRCATWTLKNLCQGKNPRPKRDVILPALTVLTKLIHLTDEEILADTCWAISFLSETHDDEVVIPSETCERLVELLTGMDSVQGPALHCIGSIVTGNNLQTQMVIDSGALTVLCSLLSSPEEKIRQNACWAISNITAGPPNHIQSVINANIIPPLIDILQHADFKTRKEACWAIFNATSGGLREPSQIRYFVSQGCIPPLCDILTMKDYKTIEVALLALANVFRIGELDKKEAGPGAVNQYALYAEEIGGMLPILNLQSHDDGTVSERASCIMVEFFPDEKEVDF